MMNSLRRKTSTLNLSMNVLKKPLLLLLFITLFAFGIRAYRVTEVPPSLSWDEVSIGYNAWSIVQTGKDEHGRFFPLDTFISFGDYKPPVAIYITAPFVALLGLTELAVRLPVVLFSTFTVFLTYFVVLELFSTYKYKVVLGLLSSFILSVSPWYLNLSRAGFEAVIALFFVVLGIWIALKAKSSPRFQLVLWIPFVIAIYTFNSSRYFVPLFAPVLVWYVYGDKIRGLVKALLSKRQMHWSQYDWTMRFVVSAGLAVLLLIPIIPHLLSPEARLRFKEVNIFTDESIVRLSNERIEASGNTWFAKIVHNRRVGYALSYAKHYLDHFEPSFLFIKGDGNPKFSVQDVGQLYGIEAVFLLVGLYAIFRLYPKSGIFLLTWLLVAIIPAGVARETPHALRILNTLPVWQISIAFGIVWIFQSLRGEMVKKVFVVLTTSLYIVSLLYYAHIYYSHYPYEYSSEWQYGYREAIAVTEKIKDDYDTIIVSDIIGRPYAYTLFYGKYDPEEFLKTKDSQFDAAGFYTVSGFGKYTFVRNELPTNTGKTLYVMPPEQVPNGAQIIDTVRLLNGKEVLKIYSI